MKKNILIALLVFVTNILKSGFTVTNLETEHLHLRPVKITDSQDISHIALNPEVIKLTGLFPELKTQQDVEDFVKTYLIGDLEKSIQPRYPFSWAMVEKGTNRVIGLVVFCAYLERHQRAEIAYATAPEFWNKGLTTEACMAIVSYAIDNGLVRIYATVDPENLASEKLLQKINMSYEGLMRSYMIIRGRRVDRKMYALIAN